MHGLNLNLLHLVETLEDINQKKYIEIPSNWHFFLLYSFEFLKNFDEIKILFFKFFK